MNFVVSGFDWDEANREKCQKHGVSLAVIENLFDEPVAVFPDPAHSAQEERFKAMGRSRDGRNVLIVFTLRGRDKALFIRPVSARYMHRKEVEYFEKALAQIDNR